MPLFGIPILIKSVPLNASSPHRIKMPVNGGTYKKYILRFFNGDDSIPTTAEAHAALKSITLEATRNKESFPIINAADVNDLNMLTERYGKNDGVTIQDGVVTYIPSQYNSLDEYHRRTLNHGTMDLSNLTFDIQTNAVVALGTVARVEVYAIYDEDDRQILGAHRRIGFISPAMTAGQVGKMQNVDIPPFDFRFGFAALHFKLPAAVVIGDFTQVRNTSVTDFLDIPVEIFDDLDIEHFRREVAGWKSLDYARVGTPTAFLPAGFDTLQILPNITTGPAGATNMKVLYELIELDVDLRKALIGK